MRKREGRLFQKMFFKKKHSAELKEDQFDPFDFDIGSPLVDETVENGRNKKELIEMGYPEGVV